MLNQIASEWLLAILGVIGILVAFIYKRDIGTFNTRLDGKADRQAVEDLKRDVQKMSEASVESKICLATINEKLGRIASDLDSEKRTRNESNADMMRQVREGSAAIVKQLDLVRMEIPRFGRRQQDTEE